MKKENITKILLLGETGVGKSSLGNYIVGKEKFLSQGGGNRVTTEIEGKISERESYKDIFIIDTPGSQDTNNEDSIFLQQLKNSFQHKNAGVRAICLLMNFNEPRYTSYLQKQIYIYCILFPIKDFWDHVSIVFTKAYHYTPAAKYDKIKQGLVSEKGLINEIMEHIKDCTEKINESKKNDADFEKIIIPSKIPVYFIDSDLEEDESQNIRTKEEIQKLIEWARTKDYLDFKNINKNKIDPNYLSSERIDDDIKKEEQPLEKNLKIYINKFYAKHKKTTFHNEIFQIVDPEPYKIEEIKEEEKISPKVLISSPEEKDHKLYEIKHYAIKSKKRVTENGHINDWEDIENQSDLESSRIISTDKIEEKITYEKEIIEKPYERAGSDGQKTIIEKYQHYKITKFFINGVEQKNKYEKKPIKKETRTKNISKITTEKKYYKTDMKYCEERFFEDTLVEFDDGTPQINEPKKEIEKDKKTKYYKTIKFNGQPYEDPVGYIVYKKQKRYKREDETDETGNVIYSKGKEESDGEENLSQYEKRHFLYKGTETYFSGEMDSDYEYREIFRNPKSNPGAVAGVIASDVGLVAGMFTMFIPFVGLPLLLGSGAAMGVSASKLGPGKKIVKQRKKNRIKNEYLITYNYYSDGTKEPVGEKQLIQTHILSYGDWEDY